MSGRRASVRSASVRSASRPGGTGRKMTRREHRERFESIGRAVWDFYCRRAAQYTVWQIRKSRLPRPETRQCVDCGARAAEVYDHRDYLRPDLVDPVCHGCNLKRGPAHLSLTRVRDHLFNGTLMSDEDEADTSGTAPVADVAAMGGRARWRDVPPAERSRRMCELLRIRWTRDKAKRASAPAST